MSERKQVAEELRNVSDWFRRNGHPDTAALVIDRAVKLLDPPARGRTVRVRACVAVDPKGAWNVVGWSSVQSDHEKTARGLALEGVGDGERISWIECDVPLPDETAVEGEVANE